MVKHIRRRTGFAVLVFCLIAGQMAGWSSVASAQQGVPFADPAFQQVWAQADEPVADGSAQRSWLWGPEPIGVSRDYYTESTAQGNLRLVQFFDKARMEITYPDQDSDSIWYVSNGLLVKEMVSGQRQTGDDFFFPKSGLYPRCRRRR